MTSLDDLLDLPRGSIDAHDCRPMIQAAAQLYFNMSNYVHVTRAARATTARALARAPAAVRFAAQLETAG